MSGHGDEDPVVDLVVTSSGEPVEIHHPRVQGASLHGSGCRHATALAVQLARGVPLPDAARAAAAWLGLPCSSHSRPAW